MLSNLKKAEIGFFVHGGAEAPFLCSYFNRILNNYI